MLRTLWAMAICLVLTATVMAETKSIKLRDGRTIVGEVTKKPGGIDVQMKLGSIFIPDDQIVSITDTVTPDEEYQKRLSALDKSSPEQRYALAEWAFNNGLNEQAREQLKAALAIRPDYEKASLLLRQVEAKLEKETTPRPGPGVRPIAVPGVPPEALAKLMLPEDDIYHIRLEELRLTPYTGVPRGPDDGVGFKFRKDVINRFVEAMRGQEEFKRPRAEEQFRALPDDRKVAYILENIGRNDTAIKNDILVKTDPQFMKDFRLYIWPVVSQHCATAQCHGGEKPQGGWKVFNIPGRRDDVDYTNFVILNGLVTKQGRRMIDRGTPDLSLLLQSGLPPEQARYKHAKALPAAVFASDRVPNYRRVLAWIQSLKGPRPPDYRLSWVPPFGMRIDSTAAPSLPGVDTPTSKPATSGADDTPFK